MRLMNDSDVRELANKNGCSVIRLSNLNQGNIVVVDDTIENLISIAKSKDGVVVYGYNYYDPDDFVIGQQDMVEFVHMNGLENSFVDPEVVWERVQEHNNSLNDIDFSRPVAFGFGIVYNGVIMITVENDYWAHEEGICCLHCALNDIFEELGVLGGEYEEE